MNWYVITSFQGTAHATRRLSHPPPKSRTRSPRFSRRPRSSTPSTHVTSYQAPRWTTCRPLISKSFFSLVNRGSGRRSHTFPVDVNVVLVHTIKNSLLLNKAFYVSSHIKLLNSISLSFQNILEFPGRDGRLRCGSCHLELHAARSAHAPRLLQHYDRWVSSTNHWTRRVN